MTARTMLERLREHTKVPNSQQLAIELGVAPSMVSRVLNGERQNIELNVLRRMADNAGLPIGQLAEWWAEEQPAR